MTVAVTSVTMGGNNGGWGGYTFRFVVKAGKVVAGGSQVRVTLKGGTNGFSTDAVYLGHATGNAFDGHQVVLTFGGSGSVSCGANAYVTSDWTDLEVTEGTPLMVSAHFTSPGDVARDNNADASSYALYFKSSANEAGTTAPGGYSTGSTDRTFLVSVEVQGAAPVVAPSNANVLVGSMLTRPASYDCLGTAPSLPSFSPYEHWTAESGGHARRQGRLADLGGHIAVFGDSGVEAQVVSAWSPFCENYGISGDTIAGLLNRLPLYTALHSARAVILEIGINDIGWTSPNMAAIKAQAMLVFNWLTGPLIWIATTHTINATWNANVDDFNSYLKAQIVSRPKCVIVDDNALLTDSSGLLRADVRQDSEHFNALGQEIRTTSVQAALAQI